MRLPLHPGAGSPLPGRHRMRRFEPATQTVEPEGEAAERAAIIANCPALEPSCVIPRGLLEDAMAFFG